MEFPVLVKVARQIFSVPAASTCVERSFSAARNIVTKRRTNIKPMQLNNVLFLRSILFISMMINGGYMYLNILFSMYEIVFVDTYSLFYFCCQHSSKM